MAMLKPYSLSSKNKHLSSHAAFQETILWIIIILFKTKTKKHQLKINSLKYPSASVIMFLKAAFKGCCLCVCFFKIFLGLNSIFSASCIKHKKWPHRLLLLQLSPDLKFRENHIHNKETTIQPEEISRLCLYSSLGNNKASDN